jgi:hypothetical protein
MYIDIYIQRPAAHLTSMTYTFNFFGNISGREMRKIFSLLKKETKN